MSARTQGTQQRGKRPPQGVTNPTVAGWALREEAGSQNERADGRGRDDVHIVDTGGGSHREDRGRHLGRRADEFAAGRPDAAAGDDPGTEIWSRVDLGKVGERVERGHALGSVVCLLEDAASHGQDRIGVTGKDLACPDPHRMVRRERDIASEIHQRPRPARADGVAVEGGSVGERLVVRGAQRRRQDRPVGLVESSGTGRQRFGCLARHIPRL